MPLPDDADLTPEALNALRESVKEWLKKARRAVWSFKEAEGSFLRDSFLTRPQPSLTTSTRCYMALAYASRHLSEDKARIEVWSQELANYVQSWPLKLDTSGELETYNYKNGERQEPATPLNNFELAHLADIGFALNFSEQFGPLSKSASSGDSELKLEENSEVRSWSQISDIERENSCALKGYRWRVHRRRANVL